MAGVRVRRFALLLVAVAASVSACGAARAAQTELSAPLEIIHGKPFVQIMINGKGPFRFVIDTGTGGEAFVTPELAQELALPSAGSITLNDPSGQGGRKVPTVSLDALSVAGVQFVRVRAAVHSLGNADGACQGLLGFALFRNFLLTLDYPHHRMGLSIGALQGDGEQSVLPFRMPDGIPVITLAIGSTRIGAQLDSGGSGLSLPAHLSSQLRFASDYSSVSNAHSLSTRFTMMGATLAGDVHLGSYTFKRPFVEINPAFPLANFGSGPMEHFALVFDQKNHLVRFDAQQRTLHLAPSAAPLSLQTAPEREAADPRLVPSG
jgi:hypothetical protein